MGCLNNVCEGKDCKMNLITVSLSCSLAGHVPLHKAAESGSLEVVTKLLDSGADLHVRNEVSRSFLSSYILGCTAPKSLSVFEFV